MTFLRRVIAAADAQVLRLRNSLTPGQRWTSAGALSLALTMVAVGSPERLLFEPSASAPVTGGSQPVAGGAPAPANPGAPAPVDASLLTPVGDQSGFSTTTSSGDLAASEASPAPVGVVALVQGDANAPRGDASMGAAFLAARQLEAPTISIGDGGDAVCQAAVATGATLAIAALDVPRTLRDCLVGSGVAVLAHDTDGAATSSGGGVISTRWGIERSLDDLGRWGRREALAGRVGVVLPSHVGAEADRALERWRSLGIDVVATVRLDSSSDVTTSGAVRELASKGAQVVVLAVPVDAQRRVVAASRALVGGARFVVADLFDSVWDEAYLPTFDGAIAYTTARGAWFSRADGEPPTQAACRQIWEQAATPATMLAGEGFRVHAWCAVTDLARRAVAGGLDAVTRDPYDSPLTSPLVPTDGLLGPSAHAVLVWKASCACWAERDAFA